jgi:hypothetical protein
MRQLCLSLLAVQVAAAMNFWLSEGRKAAADSTLTKALRASLSRWEKRLLPESVDFLISKENPTSWTSRCILT